MSRSASGRCIPLLRLAQQRITLILAPIVLAVAGLGFLLSWLNPVEAHIAAPPNIRFAVDNLSPATQYCTPPFCLDWWSIETNYNTSVAWGDYDGDGDLDLAVGNSGQPSRVYNNQGGVLTLAWSAVVSDNTHSLAWGDIDGDGDLDLAVGNGYFNGQPNNQPNRLYRNDNGALTLIWTSSESDATWSVSWGDVDGDGDLDLAAGNYGQPNRLYRNDGGTLTLAWSAPISEDTASVAWGDYDGDGDLDLAVGNDGQSNRVYRNDDGSLSLVWSAAVAENTTSVAWGDYDSDGDLDLAAGNWGEPNFIYRNDDGVLTSTPPWSSSESDNTESVAWGDFDGDGDLDVVAGNYCHLDPLCRSVRVYRNDGGAVTTSAIWSSGESERTHNVSWGDYDNDGRLDLAVGNWGQPTRLFHNEGGALSANAAWSSAQKGPAYSVAWGDYDSDGDLDLAAGNSGQPNRVYRNDNGTLTLAWTAPITDDTRSIAWGDYDDDGRLDLAVGNNGQAVRIYHNDNNVLTLAWIAPSIDNTTSVAWGDVDGDGDLDLAVGNFSQPNRMYRNHESTFILSWTSLENDVTESVAWGDVDGDGDLDLAVGNGSFGFGQPNRLYRNDGGTLTSSAVWSSVENDVTQSVAWSDYDGDGDLDLAAGNNWQPNHLYRNNGGILDANAVWSSVESDAAQSVAWSDYDSDGDLDLVAADWDQPSHLYRNDDGVLVAGAVWSSAEITQSTSVAWGDVDGDGDLDLAMGNHSSDGPAVRLYRNTRDNRLLPGSIPSVRLDYSAAKADGYSSARIATGLIPITYTIADPQGDSVKYIRAKYSPDGGGKWYPVTAVNGTQTTTLLSTAFFTKAGNVAANLVIPDLGQIISSFVLTSTAADFIADLDVSVNLTHTWDANLVMTLTAPFAHSVVLVSRRGGSGDNFSNTIFDDEAATSIVSGTAPFSGRYRPEQTLSALDGYPLTGTWMLKIADRTAADTGRLLAWGVTATLSSGRVYTYLWDVNSSGFFGQTDNMVFRIEAVPAIVTGAKNTAPGPYLYGAYAASTLPFRVRGTQVRVISGTQPISNALVYRLPLTQTFGALPFSDLTGEPFYTDGQGYLQGRGQLDTGDRLIALSPVTSTDAYTLYFTSATPTPIGLNPYTVTHRGVQTLTVQAANPLLLFNLDVSLEWDARQDTQFLSQLRHDLLRASELLYDWTNGQIALGRINVYHDKEHWNEAHLRVYATNRLRPNAAQGGLVSNLLVDPITATGIVTYGPGQINIGAVWNRYGESNGNLGEDWPRALAHEIGHFALFLDDDYLGLDANNRLIPVDTCSHTAMSDPYRDDFSEFHFQERWLTDCSNTLANRQTGRWDWKTVTTFYPWLTDQISNTGPSVLPLAVTQIAFVEPETPSTVLAAPIFNLTQNGARVQPGPGARAFLFQSDRATDLGSTTLDQVDARGARIGDRLCVYEPSAQRLGCEVISAGDEELTLVSQPAWHPDVQITPVNSRTLVISVTASTLPASSTMQARLYPIDSSATTTLTLVRATGPIYTGTFVLKETVPQGYMQVWVSEAEPRRESVTDFGLGGGAAYLHGRGAYLHGRGAYLHGRGAPVQSPDGQVTIFADGLLFDEDAFFALQAVNTVSTPLPGRTQVGQAYRLLKSANAPSLVGASINFYYAGRDVPAGEETFLRVYFFSGNAWQALSTSVNTDYNVAVAAIPTTAGGAGIYALMSSIDIPLYGPDWDLFSYPVQAARPVTDAMSSIAGYYAIVYWYDGSDTNDHWKVFAPGLPGYVNDLSTLRFAESYWISLTQSITLSLSGGSASHRPVVIQSPPATYYGPVLPSGNFVPVAGLPVFALINGQVCGRGVTQDADGQIVYSLNVSADGPGGVIGCGAPGRAITFNVDGQAMLPRVVWNNDQIWAASLRSAAISNLAASSSSPTPLGQATWFTVTAQGEDLAFAWNFGDSSQVVNGATLSHTYAAVSQYTALVTVTNEVNTATTTVPVRIVGNLSAVTIDGPLSGMINADYTFTAQVTPLAASLPITYRWQIIDRPVITTISSITDTIILSWAITGTKLITVTASNATAVVTGTHHIVINERHAVYLPLILK